MRRRLLMVLALAMVAMLAVAGVALAAPARVVTLEATLTGEQEVPGPGDRNGIGDAKLIVSPTRVCYQLKAKRIAPARDAHIHEAPRGVAGDIVVTLKPPTDGFSSGCAKISRALSRDLRTSPADYYVNVHNVPFPSGAIRGQLHR